MPTPEANEAKDIILAALKSHFRATGEPYILFRSLKKAISLPPARISAAIGSHPRLLRRVAENVTSNATRRQFWVGVDTSILEAWRSEVVK